MAVDTWPMLDSSSNEFKLFFLLFAMLVPVAVAIKGIAAAAGTIYWTGRGYKKINVLEVRGGSKVVWI